MCRYILVSYTIDRGTGSIQKISQFCPVQMAMEAQTSPSPPFCTEGLGPCELSYSHSCESSSFLGRIKNNYTWWVFWSRCGNDEGADGFSATADGAVIKDQIKRLLQLVTKTERCLVQFWGLVKNEDKTYLTTRDQPFALQCSSHLDVKKLCEYRKHCLEYLIPVDDDGDEVQRIIGPPGRVFRSGLPEYAWNVGDYTSREYPQRDYAISRVAEYWALPIYYHPTQHLPIGTLEFASPSYTCLPRFRVLEKLKNLPRELNLTTTCVSLLAKVNSCQRGEIAIIDEALSKVREICGLGYGDIKTWTISGEILSRHRGIDFIRKGQGVVGRAFSSKSACFCRDIRQLSITNYPLVPIARSYKYSACFAVCLQSSCSNNCIYVLEFFLPMNEKDCRDPRALLHILMETLEESLQSSFKIASGQELGQKLTVEVIKVSPENEFDSFEICSTTGVESTPRFGEVQRGEGVLQLDFPSQQVDDANGSMNGIHEQQNGSVGSTPRLAKAQGGEGMMQGDFSSQRVDSANAYINGVHGQQSGIVGSPPRPERIQGFVDRSYLELNLAGVDVVHNSMNGIYEQQNGIVGSSTGQVLMQNIFSVADHEPIVEDPDRDDASIEHSGNKVTNLKMREPSYTLKSDLGITREILEQNSTRKLEDAAKNIGVSRSTLKRICREYGINRWPPRKARKVSQAFAVQKTVQPATEYIEENHQSDATRLEDDISMWVIKVKYQEDNIKFELSSSARKIDLEKNIAQRFNLSLGSFKIKYQDELSFTVVIVQLIGCSISCSMYN
ncbi:protein NLP6-like isoform X2 [Coffea arabica]|uniref:Protein NLP6-like isoform X2 n=1 Tax=Coffea arabica TaxID=13443 RepID=A0ABM4URY3_COFAR